MLQLEGDRILLRVWKYKTSLEEEASVIQQAEFQNRDGSPDLRPSVYDISPADIARAIAEHSASGGCDRPTCGPKGHLDLRDAHQGDVLETKADFDWFAFTNDAHRELILRDQDELMGLIGRLRDCTRHPVTKNEVRAYLASTFFSSSEWKHFVRDITQDPDDPRGERRAKKWEKLANYSP